MRKMSYKITEMLYNKIVSVAYGEGSILDKVRIRYLAAKDNEIKKIFLASQNIAKAVRNLDEEQFPEEILKKVEGKTILLKSTGSFFLNDFISILLAKPLVSTVTAILVVTTITLSLLMNKPSDTVFSRDEIVNADKQARYALAIVNKIFTQTNSTLKEEVLTNRVSKPFNDGYNFINNLIEGEKR